MPPAAGSALTDRARGRRRVAVTSGALLAIVLALASACATGRESANARSKELRLRAKVGSAVTHLNEAVSDLPELTIDAPTDILLAKWRDLVAARSEFGGVAHAFQPGRVVIGGRHVDMGLTPDMVAPQLYDLTLAELRIQDELGRRGVEAIPGARNARQWLAALAPDLYAQAVSGYLDRKYPSLVMLPNGLGYEVGRDGLWHQSQASVKWQKAFQRGDMDPRIATVLAAMGPGEFETGLTRLLNAYGLAPFGKGVGTYELPPARPVPPPPREPKTWDDISGTGAG